MHGLIAHGRLEVVYFYLRQVNVVNIGGDYEIGRSVFVCTCTLRRHISTTVPDRRMVAMDHP